MRFYKEHPHFGEYTCFDPRTGQLEDISEEQFEKVLDETGTTNNVAPGIIRLFSDQGTVVFTGEVSPVRTRFPRRIYFQITRTCTMQCPYCFIRAGSGQAHVPTDAALKVAELAGQLGLMEVRLTGGEPTTHPQFFDIVDAFRKQDIYVSVATNGIADRDHLDGLAARDGLWIICSVDGTRETHERYRPGTYDAVISNLKYLKQRNPGLRIRLTSVLTRENKNEIRELGELVRWVQAESITLIPLRPQVRNESVKKQMLTAREFGEVIETMAQVMKELDVKMTTTLDLKGRMHRDPVVRKTQACAAGREATNLDYDALTGQFIVYGCSYSPASDLEADPQIRRPFLAGAFSPDNVEEFVGIWRNDKAWAIFRDEAFKSKECFTCRYHKNKCIGSCPIQNVDYETIDKRRDVCEQLKQQMRQTAEWYCYRHVMEAKLGTSAAIKIAR